MMRKAAISLAFSMTLAGPALAQTNPVPIPAARPAPQAARPAIHPVSKSADPTFDEGTYQRISAAMLSYSSIEVRGGWPMLPAGAKLKLLVVGGNPLVSNGSIMTAPNMRQRLRDLRRRRLANDIHKEIIEGPGRNTLGDFHFRINDEIKHILETAPRFGRHERDRNIWEEMELRLSCHFSYKEIR